MSEKYISRIDQPDKNNHGWYVRMYYGGKQQSKFFSDSVYGGKQKALFEAREHKAKLVEWKKQQPKYKKALEGVRYKHKVPRNNTTGVVGIYRTLKTVSRNSNKRYAYYSATGSPEWRKPQSICRSTMEYGELEAFLIVACQRWEWAIEALGDEFDRNQFCDQVQKWIEVLNSADEGYIEVSPEFFAERTGVE